MASLFSGSSTANNFLATTSLPCMTSANMNLQAQGKCTQNPDGQCVQGGERIAGTNASQLASLGYPGGQCVSAGLFYSGNQQYEVMGMKVTNNANPLRLMRWL